jgi:enediyne biosynthesis thioesterase
MTRSYEYRHVVTLEETNAVGNVYFTSHLRWQGRCRELFLADNAPGVVAALERDLALITTRCSCEYLSELRAFDRVIVRMLLSELRQNRVVMRFEYLCERPGGPVVVARGEQEVACMRRSDGGLRAVEIPAELRAALGASV